jgi:hypothetical protein
METAGDGTLWLKDALHVETREGREVSIGKLGNPVGDIHASHGSRIINANEGFVAYEDGHIHARSGMIGSLSIEAINDTLRKLDILSNLGYNFRVEGGIA